MERTPKWDRTEYDRKLGWYLGQIHYQRVYWFAFSHTLRERITRVARDLHMEHLVRVAPLPPERNYPPGVIADRKRSLAT